MNDESWADQLTEDDYAAMFGPIITYKDPWIQHMKVGDRVKISTKGDAVFEVTGYEFAGDEPRFGPLWRLRLTNIETGKFHDDFVKPDGVSMEYERHLIRFDKSLDIDDIVYDI